MKTNIKNILYLVGAAIATYILYVWLRKPKTDAAKAQAAAAQANADQQAEMDMLSGKRVISKGNDNGVLFLFDVSEPIDLNGENRVAEINAKGRYVGYATGERIYVGGYPFIMINRRGNPMWNGNYYVSESLVTLE